MNIIMGIDPGSRLTGYGLIESDRNTSRYLASGRIRLDSGSLPERLTHLYESLQTIISEYQPDQIAIEQVFFGKNAMSALKLGQARGVAMLVPALNGLPVYEYAARSIKQAVVGNGAADKAQVQSMIVRLLKLGAAPSEDAADALAIALCHQQTLRLDSKALTALASKAGAV